MLCSIGVSCLAFSPSVFFFLTALPLRVDAKDECQPITWSLDGAQSVPRDSGLTDNIVSLADSLQPGDINCRFWGYTGKEVNYYTCTELALKFDIQVDQFFALNPDLQKDCGDVQPRSKYCVSGFIEPVRATDGFCGPKYNNATCLGTDFPCCNAETFTCGNSTEDCAAGTCYEGACPGDKIWSTDGTCGYMNGGRQCTGKWGECCNRDGRCGSGDDFCADEVCSSGKCQRPPKPQPPVPWLDGNTTDGSCGGPQRYTCHVAYGNCCNKDGECGSLPADCGVGCQSDFGRCNPRPVTTTTKPPATTSAAGCQPPPPGAFLTVYTDKNCAGSWTRHIYLLSSLPVWTFAEGSAGSVKVGAEGPDVQLEFYAGAEAQGGIIGTTKGTACASFGDDMRSVRLVV